MFAIYLFHQSPHLFDNLADGLTLDHLWMHSADEVSRGVMCVAEKDAAQTKAWLRTLSGRGFEGQIELLSAPDGVSEVELLRRASGRIPKGELLILRDGAIVIAEYETLRDQTADICLIRESAVWFRNGAQLSKSLKGIEKGALSDGLTQIGATSEPFKPKKHLPITTAEGRLRANLRLLGIGYTSKNALERSYTEEFAVIPPVFIHPDAEIYASMIGPYVSIGAGAVVERCVLENSIVGAGAKITHLNLEQSIIKNDAEKHAEPQRIIRP
ncbi:MAG: hypothetical protein AAF633_24320 [Chloroflexota bacterium]